MRALRPTLGIAALLLAAIPPARSAAVLPTIEPPDRYELSSGLTVVLDPIAGRRTVALVVSVEVGRRDQPRGWTGLAHLTEHLLFQGTPDAPGELNTRLERLGATSINAQTGDDWTQYYELVPSAQLEHALWLEAERFAHGLDALDANGLAEQQRVLDRERDERSFRREAVWELVEDLLYPSDHPYGSARERAAEVHAIRADDVRWFFQTHYMPDRMTLSLSGGFDPAIARRWIERYFGPLRRGPLLAPERPRVPPRVSFGAERRVLAEARRSDDMLCVLWTTPPWGAPGDAELDLVASELTRRLSAWRDRTPDARTIHVQQESRHLASAFGACITVARRSGTLVPLRALDEELDALRRAPLDEAAVAAWREAWIREELLDMESSIERARRNAKRPPAFPGGVYDLSASLARREAVTASSIQRAVQRYLPRHDRLVVSIAGRLEAPAEGRVVSESVVTEGGP